MNYIYSYKFNKFYFEICLPSYSSLRKDLGYYWDLGISLSVGGNTQFDLRIGIIFGWIRFLKYK
jgi:hypothetical protein